MNETAPLPSSCADCGLGLGAASLVCPRCHRLVYRDVLVDLAKTAQAADAAGDVAGALAAYRRALDLLPHRTRQHAQISEKIQTLSRAVDARDAMTSPASPAEEVGAQPGSKATKTKKGLVAGATGAALLAWKLKVAVVFVLTKGKLLLLGFTKLGTVLSMAISLGVYAVAFGWKFAVGLLLSLYVHEMGHVSALTRYGIAARAPMFIPGFGAFVRLDQYPASPVEDARVGLAGPIWGCTAALVTAVAAWVTGWPILFAIAKTGAWLNLFNLLPVWQLDGGRAFRALDRRQRWFAAGALGAIWFLSGESVMLLLVVGAVFRVFEKTPPTQGDRRTLVTYVALGAALAAMCHLAVRV